MCVIERPTTAMPADGSVLAASVPAPVAVVADSLEHCAASSPVAALSGGNAANALHWASSGFVGFARGWNDAPKIAALSVGTLAAADMRHGMALAFAVVVAAMALGGLVAGRV